MYRLARSLDEFYAKQALSHLVGYRSHPLDRQLTIPVGCENASGCGSRPGDMWRIDVVGGVLSIGPRTLRSPNTTRLTYTLTVRSLGHIAVQGDANVSAQDIQTTALGGSIQGSGHVQVASRTQSEDLSIRGSGRSTRPASQPGRRRWRSMARESASFRDAGSSSII